MVEHYDKILWMVISAVVGIVTYYLKKRDVKIDLNETSIKTIEKEYLTKKEFEKVGIDKVIKDYVTREELEKVEVVLDKKIQKTEEDLKKALEQNNSKVMEKLEKLDEKISSLNKAHIDKEDFLRFNSRIEDKIDKIQGMVITTRKEQAGGQG